MRACSRGPEPELSAHAVTATPWSRHLGRCDKIPETNLDGVEAELVGGEVDDTLPEEIGFDPAGPAIRADGRLVGQGEGDLDVDIGDAVGPREELGCFGRNDATVGTDGGTHVG
jgi:hypothetical protein